MPRRAPVMNRANWRQWRPANRGTPKDDTAAILKEERAQREENMDRATTAALGGDYETAEHFAELAGWPIKRKQTTAPPADSAGVVRGPEGRAKFVGKEGGHAPADEKDPVALTDALLAKFAAEKGYPTATGTMPGKLGQGDRLMGGPEAEYPERVGVAKEEAVAPPFGGGEWPQTYYNPAGESRVVTNEADAKEAAGSGFGPDKPLPEKKQDKYEPRTLYKDGKSWEVQSAAEETEATGKGFLPIKPGETEDGGKGGSAASKAKVGKLKTMMDTLLTPYRGQDKLIDALMNKVGDAVDFKELANLAKNGYERLLAASRNAKEGEDKTRALEVLQRYGTLLNRMLAEEGLEPVGGDSKGAALGGDKGRTVDDYFNEALGQGTQL